MVKVRVPNGVSGAVPGSPNDDDRAHTDTRQNSGSDNRAGASRRQTHADTPYRGHGGAVAHGHWLGIGAAMLPGQVSDTLAWPSAQNVLGTATGATMTAAEYLAMVGKGSVALNGVYRAAMGAGVAVNLGMDIYNVGASAKALGDHPDSGLAKWQLANSVVRLAGNGVALLLVPLAPAAAFAPMVLPDFAEIGRANELLNRKNDLEQKGRQTEADATGRSHTMAALNATPIVNWFAPFYRNTLTPDVEKFEHAHGNYDDLPAQAELPPGTGNNPAVTDYYGNAMKERAGRVAEDMTPYLRDAAKKNGTDNVTWISHWPQTFCWPSSGKPMRTFDRAIALTYSRKTDTAVPTFFGLDIDGSYRMPPYNHDIPLKASSRHLFIYSQKLDPGHHVVLKEHE